MKTQIEIKRHDGTKFRVTLDKRESEYVVEYRNDKTGVKAPSGQVIKGKWVYLDSQPNFSDALDTAFDFAREFEAEDFSSPEARRDWIARL